MDPERPIEKLLRQAAQARRDQAGTPELHPANRRMLQSEIARKFGSAPREKSSFFELFMPRLAWSAAIVVGLGLAASLMLPRQNDQPKEMFFAKNDRVTAPKLLDEALPPTVSAAKPAAPSEAPALARADQTTRHSAEAANAVRAQAERDKDSLGVDARRAESERRQLALNEPVAQSAGAMPTEKQKEELASRSFAGGVPPQAPPTQNEIVQRRYGLAPGQPAPASAPVGASGYGGTSAANRVLSANAGASEKKPALESAKSELAYKTAPSSVAPTSSSLALQFNGATSADVAKRSPAPIARVSQQFVQTSPLAKNVELADKSAVSKPILVSFELQQLGREVRIVDSDGSVYTGDFQIPQTFSYLDSEAGQKGEVTSRLRTAAPASNVATPAESTAERKGALYDSKLQADLSYAFKVTGTNQTLNQIVTFSGQVLTPTNVLSLLGPAGTLNGNRAAPPELNPLPLQNSRISGKALIGTNREVEVNAIPSH